MSMDIRKISIIGIARRDTKQRFLTSEMDKLAGVKQLCETSF
jgi:hypothetical protein